MESINDILSKDLKSFAKSIITNKYVISGALFGGIINFVKNIKKIANVEYIQNLLPPNYASVTGVSLMGIPIGTELTKILGMTIGGVAVASILRAKSEMKKNPEQIFSILLGEGVNVIIIIAILTFLGCIGMNFINMSDSIISFTRSY